MSNYRKNAELKLMFGLSARQMFEVFEECLRYEIYRKLLSSLDWHCEDYSKEYCEEMYSLFDIEKASEEGVAMYYDGMEDIVCIADDLYNRYIVECEERMNAKE